MWSSRLQLVHALVGAVMITSFVPAMARAREEPEHASTAEGAIGDGDAGVQEIYERAVGERDAGNLVAAAKLLERAYTGLPSEHYEARASVLFELVDVLRSASTVEDEPGYLCEAERHLLVFTEEVRRTFGQQGARTRDVEKANELLEQFAALRTTAKEEHPELNCDDPWGRAAAATERDAELERRVAAERARTGEQDAVRRRKRLVIAGAVLTGVGALALGVMTGGIVVGALAERDGDALTEEALEAGAPLAEDDPRLQDIAARGQVGNIMAIAGGVAAGVLLGTGATLLGLGLRRGASTPALAITPSVSRQGLGATLTLRF